MDRERFDALVRGMGREVDRRRAVAGLIAGLTGLGLAGRGSSVEASSRCLDEREGCRYNRECCAWLKCGPKKQCILKNERKCKKDGDCPGGEDCVRGLCEPNYRCRSNRDCPVNWSCTRTRDGKKCQRRR
jgi:hypothetical protein